MVKYCTVCKKATEHRELDKAGIAASLLVAIISRFSVDLGEDDFECNCCGKRT